MNKKQYIQPTVEVMDVKMDAALMSVTSVESQGLDNEEKLDYDKSEKKSIWDNAM